MPEYFIAWWNVENLFDVEDSPDRTDKLKRTLKNELRDWNEERLAKKISQLSKIISKMNGDLGPDILGICEVENRKVVDRLKDTVQNLVNRHYAVVHADTKDERGIDVAFIYDDTKFEANEVFFHFILKRVATRDIVQVNFKSKSSGRDLVLIGNHWPSRRGSQLESEPYRIIAGETLSYFHQRIREVLGEETAILVMGDFNDEPFNRSITEYALGTVSIKKVELARDAPRLYNLMWPIIGKGIGTFYFQNFPNLLDQFMVSKGIMPNSNFSIKEESVEVVIFPEMAEGNTYKVPKKFGRPADKDGVNLEGFSDHFPISLVLKEN